jgi:hypothetical protein
MNLLIVIAIALVAAISVGVWVVRNFDHESKLKRLIHMTPDQLESAGGLARAKHRLEHFAKILARVDAYEPKTEAKKLQRDRDLEKAYRTFADAIGVIEHYREDLPPDFHDWKKLAGVAATGNQGDAHAHHGAHGAGDHGHDKSGAKAKGGGKKEDHSSHKTNGSSKTASGKRPWYEVLGVMEDAEWPTVRSSYRGLLHRWHPDTAPDNKGDSGKLTELHKAYEEAKKAQGVT